MESMVTIGDMFLRLKSMAISSFFAFPVSVDTSTTKVSEIVI